MIILRMTILSNVWDYSAYWNWIVPCGIVLLILLLSNVLRRKVGWIRRSLMPTAIIGGFIGLGVKYLFGWVFSSSSWFPTIADMNQFLNVITYHTIAIGFIALALKNVVKNNDINALQGRPVKNGLFIVSNYLMQGVLGLAITIPLALIFSELPAYAGVLLPMGFGQGPGQAGNIGGVYETLQDAAVAFAGGRSYGLAISTLGFVSACVGGVLYMNYLARKGKIKRIDTSNLGEVQAGEAELSDEIPLVDSIDRLTVQIAIVGVIYLATFLVMFGISAAIDASGIAFLINSIKPLIWGFNFIFAMFVTIIFNQIIKGLKKAKLMKRTYTNNNMMNRISGFAFDLMIISSIMAIDLQQLSSGWGLIISLAVMGILGAVITFIYDAYVVKRVYKGYENEALLVFYGMMTGTASTGIALLREVDPDFKTPAANDIVTGSTAAILLGAPLLLITSVVYLGWPWLIGSFVVLIILFLIYNYFLIHEPRAKKVK